jgi:hypothetical protein
LLAPAYAGGSDKVTVTPEAVSYPVGKSLGDITGRKNMIKFGKIQSLAIALLLGVTFASGTVQAQTWTGQNQDRRDDRWDNNRDNRQDRRGDRRGRNWDRYDNYGGSFQLRQTALNAGYNEGIKEGRRDRNRGSRNFRDNGKYRNASTDYSSRLGNKAMYQRYYREGYENGYQDGLYGY